MRTCTRPARIPSPRRNRRSSSSPRAAARAARTHPTRKPSRRDTRRRARTASRGAARRSHDTPGASRARGRTGRSILGELRRDVGREVDADARCALAPRIHPGSGGPATTPAAKLRPRQMTTPSTSAHSHSPSSGTRGNACSNAPSLACRNGRARSSLHARPLPAPSQRKDRVRGHGRVGRRPRSGVHLVAEADAVSDAHVVAGRCVVLARDRRGQRVAERGQRGRAHVLAARARHEDREGARAVRELRPPDQDGEQTVVTEPAQLPTLASDGRSGWCP